MPSPMLTTPTVASVAMSAFSVSGSVAVSNDNARPACGLTCAPASMPVLLLLGTSEQTCNAVCCYRDGGVITSGVGDRASVITIRRVAKVDVYCQ